MKNALVVTIGGDMEKDERELLENPEKAILRQPHNALYLDSYDQLYRMLSPKKLDLLRYLIEKRKAITQKTVGQIAQDLHRKQEAVSRDLHYLQHLKLVGLRKEKQTVFASTDLESIQIQMAKA